MGQPNNSPQLSLNKGGVRESPNKIVGLEENYWETVKTSLQIIIKLLSEHLPIPVIGKGLLRDCWRCSNNFYYPNTHQNNSKYPSKKWSIGIVVIRKNKQLCFHLIHSDWGHERRHQWQIVTCLMLECLHCSRMNPTPYVVFSFSSFDHLSFRTSNLWEFKKIYQKSLHHLTILAFYQPEKS